MLKFPGLSDIPFLNFLKNYFNRSIVYFRIFHIWTQFLCWPYYTLLYLEDFMNSLPPYWCCCPNNFGQNHDWGVNSHWFPKYSTLYLEINGDALILNWSKRELDKNPRFMPFQSKRFQVHSNSSTKILNVEGTMVSAQWAHLLKNRYGIN